MERLEDFLSALRHHQLVRGNFRAILHIVVGRTIRRQNGEVVSTGITWRELSKLLQQMRWDKELVRELGLNPDDLPPRDRLRYWYMAITAAKITSLEAVKLGDQFAELLGPTGYSIGSAPGN